MTLRLGLVAGLMLLATAAVAQMTGTVTGTVTDSDGQPIENAYVTLSDGGHHGGGGGMMGGMSDGGMMGGGDQVTDHHHDMGEYEAWTDAAGEFTIDEVETGDYEARAMYTGLGMDEAEITVEANQTVTVDLVLDHDGGHGDHHGDHDMHEWDEVSLDGWTIVVENDWHDYYYLDEENDGIADWHLGFGPPGYDPPGDLELPQDGDQISITGGEMMMGGWGDDLPMVMVFTLNGETWFEPDSMGGHHNGHGGGWHEDHDGCTFEHPESGWAEGWVLVDENADAHNMYWLDMDDDQQADYRLSYGTMEYSPDNGAIRPVAGDWVEIIGGEIEGCPVEPTMVVYEQNGMFWREPGDTTGLGATTTSVGNEDPVEIPQDHLVVTTYPNPFNPATTISATLPQQAELTVAVYDVLGREILNVDRGLVPAGTHRITVDASRWAAGVYFARVRAGAQTEVAKIQLMK